MIDSKKLYNWIKAEINPYGKPFKGTVFEFGNKVMNHIEAMEKQPKTDWIPCEERLPSEDGHYLTCDKHGNIHVFYHFHFFEYPFGITKNDARYYQPIAWQPLPQPYKKEGAE